MESPSPARRRGLGFWLSAWTPVLFAVSVIAVESTEYFGADHTSGPLRWLFEQLFGTVSEQRWILIHHYIRKTGHFVGYGLVALTWLRAWWMTLPRAGFFKDALLALLGTALVAASDEFHQSFLPNRTSSPWDVLLDCCGAVVMQLLFFLILRVTSRMGQAEPL
ncbi:MAG: VanZ family protein [Terracidiphilus sp.]